MSAARVLVTGILSPVILLASTSLTTGQVFESVGTRALGMAGAFVAVADDATAAYWNPAGLPTGAFLSLVLDHASGETFPEGPDSPVASDSAGTFVGLSTNRFAASYYRLHVNEIARTSHAAGPADAAREDQVGATMSSSMITHNVALTGAQLVASGLSVGTTVRYVRASYGVGQEGQMLGRSGQNEVDVDLGIKAGGERLQAGFVARNLLKPTLKGPHGGRLQLARLVRAGLAYRPFERLVVAGDIDLNRLHSDSGDRRHVALGAEQWLADWLGGAGRGARIDLEAHTGARRAVGAFGLSVSPMPGVYLDGHVTRGSDGRKRDWSVAGRVGF